MVHGRRAGAARASSLRAAHRPGDGAVWCWWMGSTQRSLDGITLTSDLVLEIKCPFQGQRFNAVAGGGGRGSCRSTTSGRFSTSLWCPRLGWRMSMYSTERQGILLEQRPEPGQWASIRGGWDSLWSSSTQIFRRRSPSVTLRSAVMMRGYRQLVHTQRPRVEQTRLQSNSMLQENDSYRCFRTRAKEAVEWW